ncbi:MAG: hypothetical protein JSU83_16220 [Deltaproteobacteria bacterium]|nr:MAG: hypothetical protein JSU83_16220 [Deltaproteobacteria bacterium]
MMAVCRGGRTVIVGNTSGPQAEIDIRYIFGKQISLIGSTMGNRQDFRTITKLLWFGKLKSIVDRLMPLVIFRKKSYILSVTFIGEFRFRNKS